MRAVVVSENGPSESLKITDIAKPEPGEGQVRLQVAYCALNPLDTHARAGRIKWGVPDIPFTLGYEYSGRVDAVGPGTDDSLIGKRFSVAGSWGGCSEYAIAAPSALVPIPDEFHWTLGTVYFTSTLTSWHMLHTMAHVQEGDVVVVHSAAGAVGVMTTQIAKDAGCTVIGLVGSQEKVVWAEQFGADHLINERAEEDWPARVKEFTGGAGADVIIDGNAGPGAPKNLVCLAPFGQVIYIGAMAGQAPEVNISGLIAASAGVRGFIQYHAMAKTKGAEFPEIISKLDKKDWIFPLNPPIPLDQIGQAHYDFENRRTTGRTVFEIGGDI
ncbi:MAG: zinc-binding dehydrogenase [Rhodospirillaceae bacterium]|jgi:NADPH:quinone reductase|nr:zinc-binding dehydrogenase [Rhodospirillaceae bacterium]